MPITCEYRCGSHGDFELYSVPLEHRNEPKVCPECGKMCNRVWASSPTFAFGTIKNDHFNKNDSYYENAEKQRLKDQKKRFADHSEKYRHDTEYRRKENNRLVSRGYPKENLPEEK